MRRQEEGFTLIELVMVIVILGILAAVAVPRYLNLTQESQTSTLNAGVSAVGSAIAIAAARHRSTVLAPTAANVLAEVAAAACVGTVVAQGRVNTTLQGTLLSSNAVGATGNIDCTHTGSTIVQGVGTGTYSST